MEELEKPRGATFLWLLLHRIAPQSGYRGALLPEPEPEPGTRLGGLQQKPVLEPLLEPCQTGPEPLVVDAFQVNNFPWLSTTAKESCILNRR